MKRIHIPLAVALLFAFTCPEPAWAAKKGKHKHSEHVSSGGAVNREATLEQLLELHNKNRAAEGASALALNEKLTTAAQSYAEYLARTGKFSHSADGSPGSRIKAAGYKYHAVGENIAKGQTSAESVVKGWMHSEGHRKNILSKRYKEVGFGFAKDDKGRMVWVTDFGGK